MLRIAVCFFNIFTEDGWGKNIGKHPQTQCFILAWQGCITMYYAKHTCSVAIGIGT
jgi:hypothetical protein